MAAFFRRRLPLDPEADRINSAREAAAALKERHERAARLLELNEYVNEAVKGLKAKGSKAPISRRSSSRA